MSHVLLIAGCLVGQAESSLDFPPPGLYQHSCPIGTNYDRFKDESDYYVNVGRLTAKQGQPAFNLWVRQRFRGSVREPVNPGTMIDIIFEIPSWRGRAEAAFVDEAIDKGTQVFFVFEKGRIKSPQSVGWEGDRNKTPGVVYVGVPIPIREFLGLASSEWIDCRVGLAEYKLTAAQRAGLRDYASRMAFDDRTLKAKLDALKDAGRKFATGKPVMPRGVGENEAAAPEQAHRASARLRMAQELEAAAIANYREIVERFPGTPEAKTAAERLKILQPDRGEKKRSGLGR